MLDEGEKMGTQRYQRVKKKDGIKE